MLTRRSVLTSAAVGACSAHLPGISAQQIDGRIAIVDCAEDSRSWASRLQAQGVAIVARYYARECQAVIPRKRLAFNGTRYTCGAKTYEAGGAPEAAALLDTGLAILSVYQFRSNSPRKFLFGIGAGGAFNAPRMPADVRAAAAEEARKDGEAALAQAALVGQPRGTAIYFGIDFDFRTGGGEVIDEGGELVTFEDASRVSWRHVREAAIAYFTAINDLLRGAYLVGAYGNGYAHETLRSNGLTTYSWVSESRSFYRTAAYLRGGDWHLFQNLIDAKWFANERCQGGLRLDGNVQNPLTTDIGAWNSGGLFRIPAVRNAEIHRQRWVALKPSRLLVSPSDAAAQVEAGPCAAAGGRIAAKVQRNRTVRVIEDLGDWLHVDMSEEGIAKGFVRKTDFRAAIESMPDW